ncbi:MAG: hypothetical protein ABL984_15490 [Pyrinomonadaceae bacterium]
MLGIIAFIAIFVFIIQVYKTAAGTGRNAALWALLTAAVGFGFQIVIPLLFGIIMAVVYIASGTPPEEIETAILGPASIVGIIGLVASIVGMVLIAKHVGKVPDDPIGTVQPPPPPPTF